jgi:excisionase family DNA binding protein
VGAEGCASSEPRTGAKLDSPGWKLAYRIPEACAATGYKRSKLYEIIKAGKIAILKDGSCTLILRSELERYLNSLRPARIGIGIDSDGAARRARKAATSEMPHDGGSP